MDPPASGEEVKPEDLEQAKDGTPLYHCDLVDSEVIHKIAQALLPGLGSACVDNTTGDLLRSAASIAVDIRREMVDYLTQRSENFVAETIVLEGGPDTELSDHPFDIISFFIDDFAASKRNFLSRVSGWVLSDRREDRIDDFVQEMEIDGFWLMARRENVAQSLLKNVDLKNEFHCNEQFKTSSELTEHKLNCPFRTLNCVNEGCNSRFSAANLDLHESICIFKLLPCEQGCSETLLRREMDRHCITICPMKLMNCPFFTVGCGFTVPQCKMNEHRLENVENHLVCVLQVLYKDVSVDDLKKRSLQILELSSPKQLSSYREARSLTNAVKNLDAKLGPIQLTEPKPNEEEPNLKSNPSEVLTEPKPKSIEEEAKLKPDPSEEVAKPKPDPSEEAKLKPDPSEEEAKTKPDPSEEEAKPKPDLKEEEANPKPDPVYEKERSSSSSSSTSPSISEEKLEELTVLSTSIINEEKFEPEVEPEKEEPVEKKEDTSDEEKSPRKNGSSIESTIIEDHDSVESTSEKTNESPVHKEKVSSPNHEEVEVVTAKE